MLVKSRICSPYLYFLSAVFLLVAFLGAAFLAVAALGADFFVGSSFTAGICSAVLSVLPSYFSNYARNKSALDALENVCESYAIPR